MAAAEHARPAGTSIGKRLSGSVLAEPDAMIIQVFDQAEARAPTHARIWIVLVDGDRHRLDLIRAEVARRQVRINIVVAIGFARLLKQFDASDPLADPNSWYMVLITS